MKKTLLLYAALACLALSSASASAQPLPASPSLTPASYSANTVTIGQGVQLASATHAAHIGGGSADRPAHGGYPGVVHTKHLVYGLGYAENRARVSLSNQPGYYPSPYRYRT